MCFSASASFTAAGLLAVIGSVTFSTAKKQSRMLGTVPLLFALQQATEGLLWLSFEHTKLFDFKSYFIYGFLFFAFIIWPLWIPISVFKMETIKKRKHLIMSCFVTGIIVALILLFFLLRYGANAQIADHHIVYNTLIPKVLWLPIGMLYLSATVVPFFITTIQWARLFGCTLLISYCATLYFYFEAFTSVWCFFAAVLSIIILMMIK